MTFFQSATQKSASKIRTRSISENDTFSKKVVRDFHGRPFGAKKCSKPFEGLCSLLQNMEPS